MNIEMVATSNAPAAIGPYSQAVKAGGFLFCSGQIALDQETGEMIAGGIREQAKRVMMNISAVLESAGANFDCVVKTTIFLVDMKDFGAVNEVYGGCFSTHKPARSTVGVATLPRGALVEIEVVAKL